MQACPGDDTITLLVCGSLEAGQIAALEDHVASCPSCSKVVKVLRTALSVNTPHRPAAVLRDPAEPDLSTSSGDTLRANAIGLLPPGTMVGRYRIVDLLGAGGMGVVYAAHDPELEREVALKLLYPSVMPDGRDELATRLRHESKVMAKLRHPNVATIHDLGSFRGQLFIVMEIVAGETLRAWVGAGKPWQQVVATFAEAGKGLAAAHAADIVHCDFKPDNVLLDTNGRPLITDFGLAHVVAGASPRARHSANVIPTAFGSSAMVGVDGGVVFGTPAYMAPERFETPTAPDPRGDVFAFCVALYEVLYGERPFQGSTVDELRAASGRPLQPPAGTLVPTWLHAVIVRGLCADRDARFPSMTALLVALEVRPRRARVRWVVSALALAGAATAGAVGWRMSSTQAAATPATCDARAELAGTWDAAARDRIHAVWTATPAGQLAWPRLARALDGYADAWVDASDAACKAPAPAASIAEFQQRCLRGIELGLHAFGDQLVDGNSAPPSGGAARSGKAGPIDPSLIASADKMVASLPSVEDCSTTAPVPPAPNGWWLRSQVQSLREELAAVGGEDIAGKFAAASTWLDSIAARAAPLGFKPLTAEVQYERAMNAKGASNKPEARLAALRDAASLAEASGDEPLAVKAWLALAFEAGEIGADFARGHEYASYARAALERLGGNARLEAEVAIQNGRLFWHEHELDDARRELGHAAELAKTDPVLSADALSGLALVDTAAGHYSEALDEQRHVLELRRKQYGDVHPLIASSDTALGDVTMRMGKLDESLAFYQQADAVAQQVFVPGHPSLQMTAHNLGGIYGALGRLDDAERAYQRAVEIARTAHGPDHPYTAKSEVSLGMTMLDRKQPEAAVSLIRHALKVDLASYGERGAETLVAEDDLGIALREAGKLDEALAFADKAITGLVALDGENDPDVADAYESKGRVLLAMHRAGAAAAAFDKAADILAHTQAPATKLAEARELAAHARGAKP